MEDDDSLSGKQKQSLSVESLGLHKELIEDSLIVEEDSQEVASTWQKMEGSVEKNSRGNTLVTESSSTFHRAEDVPVLTSSSFQMRDSGGELRLGNRVSEHPQVSPIKEVDEIVDATPTRILSSKCGRFALFVYLCTSHDLFAKQSNSKSECKNCCFISTRFPRQAQCFLRKNRFEPEIFLSCFYLFHLPMGPFKPILEKTCTLLSCFTNFM